MTGTCKQDTYRRPRSGRLGIEGEPDRATGSLAEWQEYRDTLDELPREDEDVRLAIAVADAQIEKLGRR